MKYEIEIDDSLVPEGKVPVRLKLVYGVIVGESNGQGDGFNSRKEPDRMELEFKETHVPKIPDFVPLNWWVTKDGLQDIELWLKKPDFNGKCWIGPSEVEGNNVTYLEFDSDALFGDLPPEQCCFQQKGNG